MEIFKHTAWRVLGLYAAVSWLVLQIVDVLADNVGLPAWVFTFALVLLIVGLPIVATTAYFHSSAGKQKRDHPDYDEWLPILAATHAELGDLDRAFELLNLAYDLRSTELLELKSEPWFDPLRGDPRFDALLRKMKLY